MVSLFALYRRPADEQAFLSHYESVHVPLAKRLPGLIDLKWGQPQVLGDEQDAEQGLWFFVAELTFADKRTLVGALESKEGQAASRDVQSFADGLLTMRTVEWQ
ncbi:MAG: EthD family reductase [Sulfobacillus acidophilus]|uniref:EthD family reductase n=1 Tax=Sulfobacillus acidophilus TaxID=53633 RepID=A0A2T2WN45_9FIRM|nr:MAG: EthD family reductase [Sulfobacillus acidophilus]